MSRRRRHASALGAPAPNATSTAASDSSATAELEADAMDVIDVSEPGAPCREWENLSDDTVRIELCSLNSDHVFNLSIAPGQRLRAPAIYADMVRTRAPQLVPED